ncbi:hypothetical protein BOTBODRAFT_254458 [Botryobasidium botryosum FD-172 SS1]|uniref:Integral membrane protein n=1 Tax=Botryobasidium botryosum (strain FD-172 SS1) TaxID=930990 RepID=A0A067LTK7_BOTB1|nr:hypothetical protein BOTBODRAFT_254458 [Botryobasidium botryosum FD-172 SS1]
MASNPAVKLDNLAILITLAAEILFYGMYVPLFFVCLWVMLSRKDAPNWKLIAPLITMFILSTAHIAVALYALIESFIRLPSSMEGLYSGMLRVTPTYSYIHHSSLVDLGQDRRAGVIVGYGLYNALNFIGDGIVIYRCYVICDSGLRVVALPIMLLFASTSTGVYSTASVASLAFEHNPFSPMSEHVSLASLCLSLVLNVACTGLITHRVWASARMISPVIGSRRAAKCYVVLAIIIESAAICAISTAAVIGTYASQSWDATEIAFQINVQILCIVPALMLVRAGLQQKLCSDWDSTRPGAAVTRVSDAPIDRPLGSTTQDDDGRGTGV